MRTKFNCHLFIDPWARIQQQQQQKEKEAVTREPPTTTRISLFKIRTLPTTTTRTTTTFKPRSLADLFKHREGIKVGITTTEDGGHDPTESPRASSIEVSATPSIGSSNHSASPSGIASLIRNR